MQRQKVESSVLAEIGFDDQGTLEVLFKSGRLYVYFDVPLPLCETLLDSGAGSVYNRSVKGFYNGREVAEEGACEACDGIRKNPTMQAPGHSGSKKCAFGPAHHVYGGSEKASIAAGGETAHCACEVCYKPSEVVNAF